MTPEPQHCDHECVCYRFLKNFVAVHDGTRCVANTPGCIYCPYDTRRSRPAPTNNLSIPCPVCGKWIFRANVDEGYSLFCSDCDWKQKIIPAPSTDALTVIEKYIDEMYPVPGPEGDYLYPSRKGRREVYDQIRELIATIRTQHTEAQR